MVRGTDSTLADGKMPYNTYSFGFVLSIWALSVGFDLA
jgi:hypothetical protein